MKADTVPPKTAAIAGAGIIGGAIAWSLAKAGWQVTVFDKSTWGSEASWAGAGMLAPGGEFFQPGVMAELALASRRLYAAFVEELSAESGVPIDYRECGAIETAYSAAEWDALQQRARDQKSLGIESRPLTAEQIKTFSPYIRTEDLVGALFFPDDALVDPRDMTRALRVACEQRGVEILEQTPVEQIWLEKEYGQIGERRFDAVVLAAGAWSDSIRLMGVLPVPPAEPVKGHLLGFDLQLGACPTIVRHNQTYIVQRSHGLLIAGASSERIGFDRQIDRQVAQEVYQHAMDLFPVLEKLQPSDTWTGLRPGSDIVHLGQWQESRLFLAYGHYRNGILLTPVTAQRVTAAITSSL